MRNRHCFEARLRLDQLGVTVTGSNVQMLDFPPGVRGPNAYFGYADTVGRGLSSDEIFEKGRVRSRSQSIMCILSNRV